MNRIALSLLAMLTLAAGCGGRNVKAKGDNQMKKTLVAYFSATGNTEKIAKELASAVDGDLFKIDPVKPYTSADLDWTDKKSRSTLEMQDTSSRPEIKTKVGNISQYDTVFVGFPVWWYTAPTIINTFIESNDLSGKTVVFFATSGGSGLEKANAQFRKKYPKILWKDGKTLNGATINDIKAWVKSL